MKAAIISTQSYVGKSTFMTMLSAIYSRSQRREAALFTTGHSSDNFSIAEYKQGDKFASAQIFKSIVELNTEDKQELYSYGLRQGSELVYFYDLLNMQKPKERLVDFFTTALNKINAPHTLCLIEICGNIKSEFNQEILKECDVALILATQSKKGPRKVQQIKEALPENLAYATTTIISQYKPSICSIKELREVYKDSSILQFPYSNELESQVWNGRANRFATDAARGAYNAVEFLQPMYEVLQFIFNDERHTVIGGVNTWYK